MTTTTRRSVRSLGRMTHADASAWWAAHSAEVYRRGPTTAERMERRQMDAAGDFSPQRVAGGISGEYDGLGVIGTLDHPVLSDGWDTLWWQSTRTAPESTPRRAHPDRETFERRLRSRRAARRSQARRARAAMEAGGRTLRHRADEQGHLSLTTGGLLPTDAELYAMTCPTIQRGRFHLDTVPGSMVQAGARHGLIVQGLDAADVDRAGRQALASARAQMGRYGRLLQDAPILGQPVPRTFWFDRSRGWYQEDGSSRTMHIADAFSPGEDSDLTPEEMVPDTTRQELIDWTDLMQLLESGGLTRREAAALDRHAHGVAQPDRSARDSYQRGAARARRILAGPITIRQWAVPTRTYCWSEV